MKMSYSPESNWVIQDLDMVGMYPNDRSSAMHGDIKTETSSPLNNNCSYNACVPNSRMGQHLQNCVTSPSCVDNTYHNMDMPYNQDSSYNSSTGDWPADLENIIITTDSLPTECDSPLKLEDFNSSFVYVNPSTLDPPGVSGGSCAFDSQPPKYSTPSRPEHAQMPFYDGTNVPPVSMTMPQTDVTSPAATGSTQPRAPGRGRPRAEWRITKTNVVKRCGPGRPRAKSGRKPTLGVIKTEVVDSEYGDGSCGDVFEEKRERRREQNRRAARKLREKKKVHVENMRVDYEHIILENRRLTTEVDELRRVVHDLQEVHSCHVCICGGSSDTYSPSSESASSTSTSSSSRGGDSNVMTSLMESSLATADLTYTGMER